MRRRVGMGARLTRWRELSDFHARIVGIVDVQPAFTVSANSRADYLLNSIFAKLVDSRLDFVYTEREMILRAHLLVIGGRGEVEHVPDPVVAIGQLQLGPIDAIVLHPALPRKPAA